MECIVCQSVDLEFLGPVGIQPASVTSDSKLCLLPSQIFACKRCGHMQKHFDERTSAQVREIYATYAPHHISQGREQLVFVAGEAPRTRTYLTFEQCSQALPAKGRLLDVGCGNGSVLKSAGKLLPEWELHGFDLNDKHRAEILSLPGVASFVSGSLSKLPMTEFDLVVLWQTLEHIPDALSTLLEMKSLLRPSGMLLVQVPDLARNYFDLLVIDHCSHFTFETFLTLCRRAGLAVRQNGTPWIHNCLTVLLDRTETEETICAPKLRPEAYLAWVRNAIRQFEEATRASDYVLFGTGMASIAMLRQLSRRPVCIMEEDEQRVGGTLDNLLIRSPADAPPALKVVMPFVTSTGAEIARRLQQSFGSSKGWEFVVPQDIPQSEAARGGSFQPA